MNQSSARILPALVIGAGALVVIGSIGAWGKVFAISINGTEGDGVYTLILGLAAAAVMCVRLTAATWWPNLVALACLAIAGVVGVIDWNNMQRVVDDLAFPGAISVGWGLKLMTIASFLGAILAVADLAVVANQISADRGPTYEELNGIHEPRPKYRKIVAEHQHRRALGLAVKPREAPMIPLDPPADGASEEVR